MKKFPKIMVCVTRQKTCERLIKKGEYVAKDMKGELSVVHVAMVGDNFLGNPDEGKALEYLFKISKKAGADMTVLRSENVVETLVEFTKKNRITEIVMGESPDTSKDDSIAAQLKKSLPHINIRVIPA